MRKIVVAASLFFLASSLYATASDQNGDSLASLPAAAQSTISAAMGRDLPSYRAHAHGAALEAENAQQKLTADFTSTGVEFHSSNTTWKLALRSYGRDGHMQPLDLNVDPKNVDLNKDKAAPQAKGNRVEYERGPLTEWYVNGPLGLEQGFTLRVRPISAQGTSDPHSGTKPLILALTLSGDLKASVDQSGMSLTLTNHEGQAELRYAGLSASDASGKPLRAWMEIKNEQLLLKVEDAGASYPIVVDPFVQSAKLTPSDGVHLGFFGASLAISGSTVAVGISDTSTPGAIYVFEKPSTGWTNMTQTAKLTASDGAANDYLGYSVAISGNTVVGGAPNANNYLGEAYVFVKPASGWVNMHETAKLTPSDSYSALGASVAISGNTIVVGAPDSSSGAVGSAYVFVKPSTGWTNMSQTAELTPSDGQDYDAFGSACAVGSNTVLVGSLGQAKVYLFVAPSGGWVNMTQTAKLTVPGGSPGVAMAISGDTVVTGSPYTQIGSKYAQGAAYVFLKPTNGWTNVTPTATLTAADGAAQDEMGYAVAISGNQIVAGAPFASYGSNATRQGAAYQFLKPSTGWKTTSHFNAKVGAADGEKSDEFGWSVSLSGSALLVGAPGATTQQGAAYLFQP
jgi:hypothetical protein